MTPPTANHPYFRVTAKLVTTLGDRTNGNLSDCPMPHYPKSSWLYLGGGTARWRSPNDGLRRPLVSKILKGDMKYRSIPYSLTRIPALPKILRLVPGWDCSLTLGNATSFAVPRVLPQSLPTLQADLLLIEKI